MLSRFCSSLALLLASPALLAQTIVGLTDTNRLVRYSAAAPGTQISSVAVSNLEAGDPLLGIDVRPATGQLYGITRSGRIYTIDPGTGVATPRGRTDVAVSGDFGGVDFNPVPDRMRVVTNMGQNLRINVGSGDTIVDGPINPAGPVLGAAAYINSFAGTTSTALYVINVANSALMLQSPPNDGTVVEVGPLGVTLDAGGSAGFDVLFDDGENVAVAVLRVGGTTGLYRIDLATGAATLVGALGGNPVLSGMAVVTAPALVPPPIQASALALTADNRLLNFSVADPSTLRSDVSISGLTGGDSLVGIDVRPATGVLYGVGSSGRIYTINPLTGAATAGATITEPLQGETVGIDFNPVPDRLRVVTSGGQNLRINVANGATIVDGSISPDTTQASAVAYMNSVAGTTSTALFVIDPVTSALNLQSPPNDGVQVELGQLGLTLEGDAGFDILFFGRNNTGIAALRTAGVTGLYQIDLGSGAAVSIGPIAGNPEIVGLAVQANAPAPLIQGAGLRAPGNITYDSNGVPTITAANDEDAAWLMGYAHARDRFWQMDTLRRTGSGTLAELVGPPALANDVQLRTLGLRRAAWASWARTPDLLKAQLKSYSEGVNSWLAQNPLPIEYAGLQLTSADPWSPVDSLVIGKLLAFQLSFDDETGFTLRAGAYQQAGAAAGFNGAALFFEDTHRSAPPDDRISIPGFLSVSKVDENDVALKDLPLPNSNQLTMLQRYVESISDNPVLARQLNRREDRAGSNWWMVGGQHTETGRAMLANDPHLGLDTPVLFHEGHVISTDPRYPEPMNSVGSVAPGTPWPLLGCTPQFCWGLTTNSLDVTDAFFESFVLNTYGLPTHTRHSTGIEPVLWVFQSFFANNTGDGVADSVARVNSIGYTNGGVTVIIPRRNNGPVVSIDTVNAAGISFQYAGWGATQELEAFRRVNRATSLSEFREALSFFDVGSQNFAYVDRGGTIAYFTTAEMPIREDLQNNTVAGSPPYLVRNGFGGNEWLQRTNVYPNQSLPYEILSPEEMPFTINPAQGYIANANNDPVGTTLDNNPLNQLRAGGGILYYAPGHSAYRMGRIDRELQRLIAEGDITLQDMAQLQANTQMLDAELIAPYLVQAFDNAPACSAASDPGVAAAIGYIRNWDYSSPTGIQQGFDAFENPFALQPPSETEVANSVAATLYSTWRGEVIRGTVDATLSQVGLAGFLPGSREALTTVQYLLDRFEQQQGRGASGLDFFTVGVAGDLPAAQRRDCVLLSSMKRSLDLLASDAFAPAFANSTDISTYRWGRLHRIVFDHLLGGQLSIPSQQSGVNLFPLVNVGPGLPGLARQGGFETVDAAAHNARANTVNGFMFGSGPVRRFLGEMTFPPTILQAQPGGQSGDIRTGQGYISQLPLWLVNGYKPLILGQSVSNANTVAQLQFTPR
jgi:penicillin amidase